MITLIACGAVAVAGVMMIRPGGFGTRANPSMAERVLARAARRLAVPRSGRDAVNPIPFSPEAWAEARAHFADHCASCHGNDGRGHTEMGRNLYPPAPDMRLPDTQRLTDGELYWIIENGVRLTGMPAWGDGTGHDADTWKLVHFVRHLNDLTAEQLEEMEALNPRSPSELEEERQDRDFLDGKDSRAAIANPVTSPTQGVVMNRFTALAAAFLVAGTLVFAHGGNEHVRGVVTQISAQSITVQTTAKATRTLTVSQKTTFKQAGKDAHLSDLKVGDRVVVDVPEKKNDALLIQIGAASTSAHK